MKKYYLWSTARHTNWFSFFSLSHKLLLLLMAVVLFPAQLESIFKLPLKEAVKKLGNKNYLFFILNLC